MEIDIISRDGADSGIGMKIEQKAAPAAEKDEGQKSATKNREASTRGSWYTGPVERVVTSAVVGRYSTDFPKQRLLRLSTVSARNSLRQHRTFYQPAIERIDPPTGIPWNEATESRPPLRIDMSGPSPTTYSPSNKPLYETNAPSYSFGKKESEKAGSGQKAWGKTWFRSPSPYTHKTNYELYWPSPFHYQQKSTLGPKQINKPAFPSHSIGPHQNAPVKKKPKVLPVTAPTIYFPEVLALSRMRRAPAHTMGSKLNARNWTPLMNVPGPNVYNPLKSSLQIKPTSPAFTMCVSRRDKRHDLGPFFTL